jgi:hypothetical protein
MDYERRADSNESMVCLSAIHLLAKRLAPGTTQAPFNYQLAA